ncbi:MAG: hypothetical protein ABSC25_01500 [Roseiarcus sp.]|jgi:hypothetical protein
MTISPNEAGAMLADVEAIVARVKQSRIYRQSSAILMLWGAIVVAGNLSCLAAPRWSGVGWLAADALGAAATFAMLRRRSSPGARFPSRFLGAFALFFVFGFVWSEAIGRFGPRELDAFWPTLFLFGYALAGLWFGAAFAALGLGLSALIVAGYFWSGEWFNLWLAVVNGGGFVLCGLWMRRA